MSFLPLQDKRKYTSARNKCIYQDAQLTTANTQEEIDFLVTFKPEDASDNCHYWIGLNALDSGEESKLI